ncbi:STAS domain-containing protein [Nocardia sp. NPDC050710]|uniref:STAS domain-containing protein n=1 Tax=Nocardia sp. NPDC050710 TaxID=3157220 RepID=UPI0033FCF983
MSIPPGARPDHRHDGARSEGSEGQAIRYSVSRPRADTTLIEVIGEIDLWTAPTLRENLVRAFGSRGSTVVVDLSPVTFLAAAGLTLLIDLQTEAERYGCRILLITTARPVNRVIEITGLAPRFQRIDSLDAALTEPGPGYQATA